MSLATIGLSIRGKGSLASLGASVNTRTGLRERYRPQAVRVPLLSFSNRIERPLIPYWSIFLLLAIGAIFYQSPRAKNIQAHGSIRQASGFSLPTVASVGNMAHPILFGFAASLLVLFIGLRYRVGGDWFSYLYIFEQTKESSIAGALNFSLEPGYLLLNWIAGQIGASIWFVNLICAIPFIWGLVTLSKQQPNPWLALVVATPFFVIGVGMGYTRQAAAVGFLLIGLASLARGAPFWKFAGWMLLGALFHRTALIAIPIGAMLVTKNVIVTWAMGALATGISFYTITPEVLGEYSRDYIEARYESAGAAIRLAMNAVPAAMILLFPKQFHTSVFERSIWRGWSLIAFIAVAAFFFVPSSVAIDRMSVYVIPVQIYALSRLPTAFARSRGQRVGLTFAIILYSALVQFVWLNYANHAKFWIPYQIYTPFM